jgi:Lon protease-like protein
MHLPRQIPLFPLPNAVLFPGVPLPLHIFEPRYREMVRDAQEGDAIIGMTLLRGGWQKEYYGAPAIFATGCAGKLVSVEALPDGRFNILLHGLREFSIVREREGHAYREAEVRWRSAGAATPIGSEQRRCITGLLERFMRDDLATPAHKLLHDPSLSDELLVNFFCYALDLTPLEKQGLLEALTLTERAQRLRDVLEFHLDEIRLAGKSPAGSDRWH